MEVHFPGYVFRTVVLLLNTDSHKWDAKYCIRFLAIFLLHEVLLITGGNRVQTGRFLISFCYLPPA
jgi:hypothetical protein